VPGVHIEDMSMRFSSKRHELHPGSSTARSPALAETA